MKTDFTNIIGRQKEKQQNKEITNINNKNDKNQRLNNIQFNKKSSIIINYLEDETRGLINENIFVNNKGNKDSFNNDIKFNDEKNKNNEIPKKEKNEFNLDIKKF